MNRNRYNSLASADSNASELHDIWEEFSCNGRDCDLEDMMPTPSPLPSRRVGHHYNGCCFIRLFFRGGIFPSSFFSSYIRGCLVAGQSPWVRAWTEPVFCTPRSVCDTKTPPQLRYAAEATTAASNAKCAVSNGFVQ